MAKQETLQLVAARVMNFGCFRDSGVIPIEDVTVLLAENENGKTTFLRALAWFSSDVQFDEEDRWSGASEEDALDVVELSFELSDAAAKALGAAGFPTPARVTIARDTDGDYFITQESDGETLEEEAARTRLIMFQQASSSLMNELREARLAEAAQDDARDAALDRLAAAEPGDVSESVRAALEGALMPQMSQTAWRRIDKSLVRLAETEEAASAQQDPYELLKPFLPRLIYFDDEVDTIRDQADYAEVSADPESHRTMINLARLVRIDLASVASDRHIRQRQSRTASQTLSREASRFWQGDPVTFHITLEESALVLSVDHKGRDQKPSRRSRGLQWFLGFYVNFMAETQGELRGAVLLLDEPGLRLHIKQQGKLLELFDEIANENQIIYSTHLPHMIPRAKLHRLRMLVPGRPKGTIKIEPNVRAVASGADVLQPVRSALGLGIAEAVSLGSRTVVVEGWVDPYILGAMSTFCRAAGLASLPEDGTVLPAGGAGKKMLPLAAFLAAGQVKGAVLVDDDRAGRDAERELKKAFGDQVTIVRTHDSDGAPSGLELEDLLGRAYYVDLVNESHKDVDGFSPLKTADLGAGPITDAVKAAFEAASLGDLQKIRPARELQARLENGGKPPPRATLAQFSELLMRLTAALEK